MATGNIIVRVQSPIHGTKRIETKTTLKIEEFLKKVQTEFNLPVNGWKVWTNREKTSELVALKTKTLNSYQVKHGDMLYLDIHPNTSVQTAANSIESVGLRSSGLSSSSLSSLPSTGDMTSMISRPSSSSLVRDGILEDEVDQFLWKQDGRIERERNEQLCRHGPLGKCLHCVPYEPYD
jgi:nuclear protein localization family protein 4